MYIDRQIKKEIVIIIVLVLFVLMLFFGVSYAYFIATDSGEDSRINIGDLEITFCVDDSCKKDNLNYNQIIGLNNDSIYPYASDNLAIKEEPYIFSVKNTGSLNNYLTIKLVEDSKYKNENNYEKLTDKYSSYLKIAISSCDKGIDRTNYTVMKYGLIEDNIILKDELLEKDEIKTYCLWSYLSNDTPNEVQNTYFVANLDFSAEYKPK